MRLFVLHAMFVLTLCQISHRCEAATHRGFRLNEGDAIQLTVGSTEFLGLQLSDVTVHLPYTIARMTKLQIATAVALQRAGWIRMRNGRLVVLQRARKDSRFYLRPTEVAILPVARKEYVRTVSYVGVDRNLGRLTLQWRWVLNDIGTTLPTQVQPDEKQLHTVEALLEWGTREWWLTQLRTLSE